MVSRTRRRREAGFTMLEVLTAALVLGIGLIGILGMQSTSAIANRRAYDMRAAMELGETTLERLKRDAVAWTGDPTAIGAQTWLGFGLDASRVARWTVPPNPVGVSTPPMYNDMGLPNADVTAVPNTRRIFATKSSRYCVQYRLTWVIANQLARADVRVFWANNRQGERAMRGTCAFLTDGSVAEADLPQFFEWVQVAGMVRWNQLGAATGLPPN